MLTESCVMIFSPSRAAEVKYSSRKIALKTARDGEKNMTQDSVNIFFKLLLKSCFKFCILEQIIATVLFMCISSINNKRSWLNNGPH